MVKLNQHLKKILDSTITEPAIDKVGMRFVSLFGGSKIISIPLTVDQTWLEVKKHLRTKSKEWGSQFSDETIDNIILHFVYDVIYNKKNLSFLGKYTKKWLSDLRKIKSQNYIFIRPVHHLILKKQLRIGKVRLVTISTRKLNHLINAPRKMPVFSTREILEDFRKNNTETVAIIEVQSTDQKQAEKLSKEYLEIALNAIRLFNSTCTIVSSEDFMNIKFNHILIIKSRTEYSPSFESLNQKVFTIIDSKYQKKLEPTWNILVSFLFSNSLTQIQSSILTALYWYGEGFKDRNSPSSFLKFMTALENLLICDRKYDKGDRIAERLSGIMYTKKGSGKKKCHELMKSYYDIRNDIIHAGKTVVNKEDVEQVRVWAQTILQVYIRSSKKYKDFPTLLNKRYSVVV